MERENPPTPIFRRTRHKTLGCKEGGGEGRGQDEVRKEKTKRFFLCRPSLPHTPTNTPTPTPIPIPIPTPTTTPTPTPVAKKHVGGECQRIFCLHTHTYTHTYTHTHTHTHAHTHTHTHADVCIYIHDKSGMHFIDSLLQCDVVCCSVVAVCCSIMQYVAVCCSMLQCCCSVS